MKSRIMHVYYNYIFRKKISFTILGFLWVMLGLCCHWGPRRATVQEDEEIDFTFREEPHGLLLETRYDIVKQFPSIGSLPSLTICPCIWVF